MKKVISRGYKRYLRNEKARIRQEILNIEEQNKLITELYQNISPKKDKVS